MQNILLSYLQISPAGTPQKKEEYHWINAGHVHFYFMRACAFPWATRARALTAHAFALALAICVGFSDTRAYASGYAQNSNFASGPSRVCGWYVGGYMRTRNNSPRADLRTFKMYYRWLQKYPLLVYSKVVNGGFCKFCALFSENRVKLGVLVNKPFTTWVKVHNIVDSHASNNYHIRAVEDALDFQCSIEQPQRNIDVRMNTELFHCMEENRHIIKCCAESILYCGRQYIALWGDNEKLDQSGNPGNFLAMLKLIANHDPVLKAHLEKPRQRNATSSHTQNEIIDIIGKRIIQKNIVREIIRAQFYSVIVDEVTSHSQEIMPLCVRFVDANKDIREEFIQFSTLTCNWRSNSPTCVL